MMIMALWFSLLVSLGLLSITKLALSLLYYAYAYFLRPPKDLKSRYGPWAVVTGPTDGIGRAMAMELARRGLHLVLVGRNPAKLAHVRAAITAEYPDTKTRTVVFDLAGDTDEGTRRLKEAIKGIGVGVLVNNAGVSSPSASYFDEGEVGLWAEIVRVNLVALTAVTRAVVEGMVERGRGAIVNVGSGATSALPSFPLFSIYAATKRYVDQFSRSLYVEYKHRGIDVQCQVPMYVATKMVTKVDIGKWSSPFVTTPGPYARTAVDCIGYEMRCVPYFPHFLQWCLARLLPDFIHDHVRLHAHLKQRERSVTSLS